MRLLLDTHAVLWAIGSPDSLEESARQTISDPANLVMVSAVSAWEIAIKTGLGKLVFEGSLTPHILASGFAPLPITLEHAEGVTTLPQLHADPFDRLLVSQAMLEDAVIITRDRQVRAYDVETLLC